MYRFVPLPSPPVQAREQRHNQSRRTPSTESLYKEVKSHVSHIMMLYMSVVTISFSASRLRRGLGGNRSDAPETEGGDGGHLRVLDLL